MAQNLASRGISVAVHEWRGNDSSSLRPSRHSDWGYGELLTLDIPASLEQAVHAAPNLDWYLGGHSLGGQLAALSLALAPDAACGLVLVATGVPDARTFRGSRRVAITVFANLIPVFTRIFGYFPGDRLRWAGREAATLMRQWSGTVRSGRYDRIGLTESSETALQRMIKPALGLCFQDDWLAPEASLDALFGKLGAGNQSRATLDGAKLGDRADHFRWMKTPGSVTAAIAAWIQAQSLKS